MARVCLGVAEADRPVLQAEPFGQAATPREPQHRLERFSAQYFDIAPADLSNPGAERLRNGLLAAKRRQDGRLWPTSASS